MNKISPRLTLFALAINAFAIGSTEFISVGLLPMIVKSFNISLSQAGLTVATVTGVPLGTFIGQQTSWNMSFIFIATVGLIGLIADYFLIPKSLPIPGKVDLHGFIRIFTNKPLVLSFLITAFGYGGTFAAYTYLSPLLEGVGFSANAIVIILVIYGVMVAIGNTLGGRFANTNPLNSLIKMFELLMTTLLFLFVAVLANNGILTLLASILLGLFAFMNVPGLQLYVVQLAEKYVPNDITLASALNIAAFNIGITLGSFIGSSVTDTLSVIYTPLFGAIVVIIAIVLILFIRNDRQSVSDVIPEENK